MISASSEHPWRAANFIAGTYATGEHEIALSQDAAKKAGLQVGDTTRLIVNGEPHTMKVSGVFTTQTAELGVLIILAQPALVNQLMQLQGEDTSKVDKIGVYGNRTTPLTVQKQHQLADRINRRCPRIPRPMRSPASRCATRPRKARRSHSASSSRSFSSSQ